MNTKQSPQERFDAMMKSPPRPWSREDVREAVEHHVTRILSEKPGTRIPSHGIVSDALCPVVLVDISRDEVRREWSTVAECAAMTGFGPDEILSWCHGAEQEPYLRGRFEWALPYYMAKMQVYTRPA